VLSRRHSRIERVRSGICVEFDSGCTVRLVDPVEESLVDGWGGLTGRTYLFVDMLQWSVGMLAVTNTMTSYTCLTSILFALDQHLGVDVRC
jgi:hypothetical protein